MKCSFASLVRLSIKSEEPFADDGDGYNVLERVTVLIDFKPFSLPQSPIGDSPLFRGGRAITGFFATVYKNHLAGIKIRSNPNHNF